MRVLRSLKRVLEKIRANVDQVLSTGLGLKPKSFWGLMMRTGFRWKKVKPHHSSPNPESLAVNVLELGSVEGLRDASTEMASMVVRGDLLKSMESVIEAPELAPPISVVSNGFSNVPREGLTLAMVCLTSPQSMVSADPVQMEAAGWLLFFKRWRNPPSRLIGNLLRRKVCSGRDFLGQELFLHLRLR